MSVDIKEGMVLEIQRMSTEDGPGLRTTVFLKGCPLHCSWCHNPESISGKSQLQWIGSNCISCGSCVNVCPGEALSLINQKISIDRELCSVCGQCVAECPTNALEILGKRWTSDHLVEELVKDRAFFEESGGGVTVSGGEAMMQPDFTGALLRSLSEMGIHTTLDTCGLYRTESLEKYLPYIDLVLFDFKEIDPDRHQRYTGADTERIHMNFEKLVESKRLGHGPSRIWVRTPVIPGATAREENIKGISTYLKTREDAIDRWEICAFNNLCKDKYIRLGQEWQFDSSPLIKSEEMDNFVRIAVDSGFDREKVLWTGMTAKQEQENGR